MNSHASQGHPRSTLPGARGWGWGQSLDIYKAVLETIDLRSFSNLWFWIALAVLWSTTSHWVLGVPYDMLVRARRMGGQAEADFEALARINVNRILYISRVSGLMLATLVSFVLTVLIVLGFWYDFEFAQAVAFLLVPLSLVGLMSVYTAHRIEARAEAGEALRRRLILHRLATQGLGILSIFVTALWGMYQNLSIGVLGG